MKESGSRVVKIGGVSRETFEVLLGFMYSGEVNLTEENITDVFPAAELFQLIELENVCCDYFVNQLCTSNCLGIWRYACNHSNQKLEKSTWFYIASNFMELITCEEFQHLTQEELCMILSSDDLDISNEMDAYIAATVWLSHNVSVRRKYTMEVLSCVRFPLLSASFLSSLSGSSTDKSHKAILAQARNAQRLRRTKSRQQKIAAFKKRSLTPRKTDRVMAIAGGYAGDFVKSCEIYDPKSRSWREHDLELPACKHFHWIGVIGMRLYALSGDSISNINTVISRFTSSAARLLSSTAFSTEWECEATLPHDCSGMQICIMNECIYASGETTLNDVLVFGVSCYDPSSGTWEFLSSMPQARALVGFTGYKGKLYLAGGVDPGSGAFLTRFESYNPTARTWVTLLSFNSSRYHPGTVVLNDYLYLIGGIGDEAGETHVHLKSVERYCFKTQNWSFVGMLNEPRAGMATVAWKRKIFVVGGDTPEIIHSADGEEFDPESGIWKPLTSLMHARIYPSAIAL